jgi:hypothetical protein
MAVGAPAAASDNMNADLLADHAFRRWGVLVDERFDFIAARKKGGGRASTLASVVPTTAFGRSTL